MPGVFLCSVLAWSGAASAASVTDCTSTTGPPSYYTYSCASTCVLTGNPQRLQCSATYVAEADEDWSGIGDYKYTVFGTLTSGGSNFCCYVDDSAGQSVEEVELNGTSGADWLLFGTTHLNNLALGHDGDDLIVTSPHTTLYCTMEGQFGADTIDALAGSCLLYGGAGADTIHGSDEGAEVLYGEGGDDWLDANGGADSLFGGAGRDTLDGGDGDDNLWGDGDGDWLRGDAGDDWLFGGTGADVLCSGAVGDGSRNEELFSDTDLLSESPNDTDILWVPVAHTGTVTGAMETGDYCGDSGQGSYTGQTCSLTQRPADCPNQ